jgi:hypothetical protein
MSIRIRTAAAALFVAGVLASGSLFADTPVLDQREQNQKERIQQGVASGELTRPEAHRLRKGERRLNRNEAQAKADGVVTPAERAQLHREAGRESKRIYRQKHDAQVRH